MKITRSLQAIALILACLGVAKIHHDPLTGTFVVIVAIILLAASWFVKPRTRKAVNPDEYHIFD